LKRVGKQVGQADGVIYDKNGAVLAKGSTTCLIFRPKGWFSLPVSDR
jgi:acyl-coenzyme A thioesterase PaaI-like protein